MILEKNKGKENFVFIFMVILAAVIMTMVYITAGQVNYGLEGDEVFSYISSTSEGGFKQICFLDDQTWYDSDYFVNALSAKGGERFNIKMVFENQTMDTHPPLYYLFLNFVCSVFEGRFSSWFGIGLNIFFMYFMAAGLYLLLTYFLKNRYISLILDVIFCCSKLSVNMVLFIRMYVLLMAIVVFQTWYHFKFYDKVMENTEVFTVREHLKYYIGLGLFTILGALTHYYFLVYQCLTAFVYVAALIYYRRYRDIFRYAGTMAVSGILYICIYPAVLTHIFFKYRGREAVHKFLKGGTLFGDVISMFSEFNSQLFKGWLLPFIFILIFLTGYLLMIKKIEWKSIRKGVFLTFPSLIYFFGISKASPYVSIRYISPVAPLLFTALMVWIKCLIEKIGMPFQRRKRCRIYFCMIIFFMSFYFFREPIKSEYFSERREVVNELAKEVDHCVYITADEYNWKMWEDYVNYPQFQGLYFIDGIQMNDISDEKLIKQDKLVIYIDKALDPEEMYTYLSKYLTVRNYEIKYETAYTYIVLAK